MEKIIDVTFDFLNKDQIKFIEKLLERLKGYRCGEHKQLEEMMKNRIKELDKSIKSGLYIQSKD